AALNGTLRAPFQLLTRSVAGSPPVTAAVQSKNAAGGAVPTSYVDKAFPYRLRNTGRSLDELTRSDRAVLLRNAFIDTASPLTFSIPEHLRADGNPDSYIIQARGPIDTAFRSRLREAN